MRNFRLKTSAKYALASLIIAASSSIAAAHKKSYFPATNQRIHYVGRIDFTHRKAPRFWAAGVYIQARFKGSYLIADLNDEVLYNKYHNYLEVAVDDEKPRRIQIKNRSNHLVLARHLKSGTHLITICKNTESAIGYLEFTGLYCKKLLPWVKNTRHKIEFIGNSITCGTGSDLSVLPCDKGEWYDQHNAYLSYGPSTARKLNSEWHLTSVSGIGLMHSCCNLPFVMPQLFDKVNLRENAIAWDFERYVPDVVTVELGQNDGVQDSVTFCRNYMEFLKTIRTAYPQADIICLTSPMADDKLLPVLKSYLSGITSAMNAAGDSRIHQYFFSRRFSSGCGGHPDLNEHAIMANGLSAYIKKLKGW